MSSLVNYAKGLVARSHSTLESCEVFAKILTPNDDSGRHGVLIPTDAYQFFPDFEIVNPKANATLTFSAFNSVTGNRETLAYKYYERYPERRITRLPSLLNDLEASPRMLIFLRVKRENSDFDYYFDCANSASGGRFDELFALIFGQEVSRTPGNFVIRPVDSDAFSADAPLKELLEKFDSIKHQGWIDSLRSGDTGKRLAEKHSRAAFITARVRETKTKSQFSYQEFVYCDRPSIDRFINLVANRNIVFEFTMSEKSDGKVRNHGYPWRLIRAEFLDQLFTFQVKLR